MVPITKRVPDHIVSVEAQRVEVDRHSGGRTPANRTENLRSNRWPLYTGVFFVILAALLVSKFWHANQNDQAKLPQSTAEASSGKDDGTARVEDIIDEAPGEKASSNGYNVLDPRSQIHEGVSSPDPKPSHCDTLPTNTRIQDDVGISGHGELTVENGTSEDAAAELSTVGSDQTVRYFFAQAHSSARMANIPEGIYTLAFTTGLCWNESQEGFGWHASYSEFEKTLEYKEQRNSSGVLYDSIRLTLHTVAFGNVRTKSITKEEFLKRHRHVAVLR